MGLSSDEVNARTHDEGEGVSVTTTEVMTTAGLSKRYEYVYDGDQLYRRRRLRRWQITGLALAGVMLGDHYRGPEWEPLSLSESESRRVREVSQ